MPRSILAATLCFWLSAAGLNATLRTHQFRAHQVLTSAELNRACGAPRFRKFEQITSWAKIRRCPTAQHSPIT